MRDLLGRENRTESSAIRCRRAPMIRWVDSQDGTTLLDLRSGRYFRLNMTASLMWRGLADGKRLDEIANSFLTRLRIPEVQLKHDLQTFVDKLVELGYVEIVSDDNNSINVRFMTAKSRMSS